MDTKGEMREVLIMDFAAMRHVDEMSVAKGVRSDRASVYEAGKVHAKRCPSIMHSERVRWEYCRRGLRES